LALVAGLLLLFQPPAAGWPAPTLRAVLAESRPDILVASVHSVDSASGTLRLLTGRGHALRIVQVSLPRGVAITRMGAALALSDLKPGMIVRVRFTVESKGEVQQASEVAVQEGGR